ncbi:MAG: hypothetical protein H7123_04870, partial [Thermoleophilia bacterium]|nr:hypothetical protein [Thermoleophilia bacterium]
MTAAASTPAGTAVGVTRVLVANRGEIAVRIMRACHELGIETVAVYSDADRSAPHVRAADQAVHIGPTPARESYLSVERIIAAAVESGADAVHPGYGFLSEQADFADACLAANLTFIGPSGAAMRASGDKTSAKELAQAATVPTVTTWPIDAVPDSAYPVLVKAAAGGGGRGMRIVESADALPGAIESAGREAAAGFGDDTLLVEQLIRGARHVVIQLLADTHGTTLYVGDRDCSLQRRHQKVVEEAPAPGLSDKLRTAIGESAVRIAVAAGYVNAGTAEFLVDPATGEFWFLELNARLQVEHPVTELAFGIDLVHWQLRIARGEHLTLIQSQIRPVAHAIEVRLYAEDPITLLPTGGRVAQVVLPSGPGVRVDHALEAGMEVSLAYDPMLGKIITVGATRNDARLRLLEALGDVFVPGVVTNGTLPVHALALPVFIAARHDIYTPTTP